MAARYPMPSWEWALAGFGHLFAFATVALARCGEAEAPLFRDEDVITVEMAGPPTTQTRMPQKAERAPDTAKGAPRPDAPPPPPNASELSLPTKDPVKGAPTADDARQALLDEMRREQLIRDMTAPEGKVDRLATSDSAGTGGVAQSGVKDPALAKWVLASNAAIEKNFHRLPAWCAANPDLLATAKVLVHADGSLEGEAEVVTTSRNPSFDAACVRAFANTGRLPALPEKYSNGITAVLECPCS